MEKYIRNRQQRTIILISITVLMIMQLVTPAIVIKNLQAHRCEEASCETVQSENVIKETGLFKTSKKHSDTSYMTSYTLDYSWFFEDNLRFNEELCHTAAMWSALVYDGYSFNGKTMEETLARYMDGYEYIDIQGNESDVHGVHAYIGHKLIKYDQKIKEVVMITIRGTAERSESISNFDIGSTNQYNLEEDWTNVNNTKGFDIAATRALREINKYIEMQLDKNVTDKPAVFLTGHSRGGAIANILANKMYIQSNIGDIYAYTFASPNTTTSADARQLCPYIFNIVNEEDLVPCLPPKKWRFDRYGRTISKKLNEVERADFKNKVGKKYRTPTTEELEDIVQVFAQTSENRDVCYKQGDVSPVTLTKRQYENLDAELKDYYSVVVNPRDPNKYDLYQQPMYFMTLLGTVANAEDNISEKKKFVLNNVAKEYAPAKWKFIKSSAKIKDAHYPDTYIIISKMHS